MRVSVIGLVGLAVVAVAGAAPASLRQVSPFAPPDGPAPVADSQALGSIELTGILVMDKKPRFNLHDLASNRSFWILLGQSQNGLTATGYDAASNSVVVEGRGGVRAIRLKEARVISVPVPPSGMVANSGATMPGGQPRPIALPEPLPANLTPQQRVQRQQETEARMMVSDLLELSMQERARYQEQMRRRAAPPQNPAPGVVPQPGK